MIKSQVFYSFHYIPDNWRVATVRSIGSIEGNKPAPDNDWESIVGSGDRAIESWIQNQMKYRSCTVVLVGENTANRKWINYEIKESWKKGMGVVGIRIHGLKNSKGFIANKGDNPFDYLTFGNGAFSSIVKCYNPAGNNSQERYGWIAQHIGNAVAEAITIRKHY